MRMIAAWSLRRFALRVAAVCGIAATLTVWWRAPGWQDWEVDPWFQRTVQHLVALSPSTVVSRATASSSPLTGALGLITLLAVPERRSGAVVVLRDGLPVSAFAGGPVTVLVAPGDTLAVDSPDPGTAIRVLAVTGPVALQIAPLAAIGDLPAGVAILGRVARSP